MPRPHILPLNPLLHPVIRCKLYPLKAFRDSIEREILGRSEIFSVSAVGIRVGCCSGVNVAGGVDETAGVTEGITGVSIIAVLTVDKAVSITAVGLFVVGADAKLLQETKVVNARKNMEVDLLMNFILIPISDEYFASRLDRFGQSWQQKPSRKPGQRRLQADATTNRSRRVAAWIRAAQMKRRPPGGERRVLDQESGRKRLFLRCLLVLSRFGPVFLSRNLVVKSGCWECLELTTGF